MSSVDGRYVSASVRVGHLLRVSSYLDGAISSMWMPNPRSEMLVGMARASLREQSPGAKDEDFLEGVRNLMEEAITYRAEGDFPAAMARMRVAQDLLALRIIQLAGD